MKSFVCSLCHNGILGGGLYLDSQSLTYKTNKLTVDKKYRNLVLPMQEIKGALPSRQLKLILAWCVIHQDELMQNWELSKDGLPLNRINPLV